MKKKLFALAILGAVLCGFTSCEKMKEEKVCYKVTYKDTDGSEVTKYMWASKISLDRLKEYWETPEVGRTNVKIQKSIKHKTIEDCAAANTNA